MSTIIEEMWKTKGILFNFAISDLKIRYRNSVLGVLWSIIEPLLMLGVLFFVFSTLFKFEIPDFPIYLLVGIITWNFFKNGTGIALNSLKKRSMIMTQIYYPRVYSPISAVLTSSIMLLTELSVLGIFMAILGFIPPVTILLIPLVLALEFLLILGLSLSLSVLNAKYNDVEFIWGIILQIGFFATPIFYKFTMLPEYVREILQFSPMVQITIMMHHLILYGTLPPTNTILYSIISILILLCIGFFSFRKLQSRIVEDM